MLRGFIYLIICGSYRKIGRSSNTSMCVSIIKDHFPPHNREAYIFPVNNYVEAYKDLLKWIVAEEYIVLNMLVSYMYTLYAVYGNKGRIHVLKPKPKIFRRLFNILASYIRC